MSEVFTREFLNAVLDRDPIATQRLDQLMALDEGQFHDFKGGPSTKKKPGEVLRKYLAGFANAEGGVLVMGVSDDKPRQLVDASGWLTTDPARWATSASRDLLPFLVSPPVFTVVDHSGSKVLLAAVERSDVLVPCIEGGRTVYYYRSGDSTFEIRESLIADLLLGRRRGPTLNLSAVSVDCQQPHGDIRNLSFGLRVENESFATAPDLHAGLVTWSLKQSPQREPNGELRRAVDLIEPAGGDAWAPAFLDSLSAARSGPIEVRPFATQLTLPFKVEVRVPQREAKAQFAVFLAPQGSPPQWFQCSLDWKPDTSPSTRRTVWATTERLHRKRPAVSWTL